MNEKDWYGLLDEISQSLKRMAACAEADHELRKKNAQATLNAIETLKAHGKRRLDDLGNEGEEWKQPPY